MKLSFKIFHLIAAIAISVQIVSATDEVEQLDKSSAAAADVVVAQAVDKLDGAQAEAQASAKPIVGDAMPKEQVVQPAMPVASSENIEARAAARSSINAIDEEEQVSTGTKEDNITPEGRLFGIPLLAGKTLLFLKFRRFLPFPLFWFKSANGDILRPDNWDHVVAPSGSNFPGIENVENLQKTDEMIIVPISVTSTVKDSKDNKVTRIVDELVIENPAPLVAQPKNQRRTLQANTFKTKKLTSSMFNLPALQKRSKIIPA